MSVSLTDQERERLMMLPTDEFLKELNTRWRDGKAEELRRFVERLEEANLIDTTDLKPDVEAVIREHIEWIWSNP